MPTKTTTGLAIFALAGWFCFWAASKRSLPTPEIKTVYQERVVYKDRVVHKTQVRTETRPDGTRVVTETKADSETTTRSSEKRKESVTVGSNVTHYSLGLSVQTDVLHPFQEKVYGVEAGARLGTSPLWLTLGGNTKHEITAGLRWEF